MRFPTARLNPSKTSKVSIRHNSVSRAITGRKKNDAKKPKKEFILGASLPFQKSSRIWKGFLGIWDLYEIPENAKFLEEIRDLTTTRQAGLPKIFARDVVLEMKMVFGMIKMTDVPGRGIVRDRKGSSIPDSNYRIYSNKRPTSN